MQGACEAHLVEPPGQGFGARLELVGILAIQRIGDDAARFEPRGDLTAFAEFANGQDQGVRLGEAKFGGQKSHVALSARAAQGFGVGDDRLGVFCAESLPLPESRCQRRQPAEEEVAGD